MHKKVTVAVKRERERKQRTRTLFHSRFFLLINYVITSSFKYIGKGHEKYISVSANRFDLRPERERERESMAFFFLILVRYSSCGD